MALRRPAQEADHVRDDVRHDDIGHFIRLLQQIAVHDAHLTGKAIFLGVLRRDLDRKLIQINRKDVAGAQLCRRKPQNAAAAAHVDRLAARRHVLFQLLHAHEGCLMRARTERHTRVELQHEVAFFFLIGFPARLDDEPLARAEGLIVLLPVLRPVLLLHVLMLKRKAADVKAHVKTPEFGKLLAHQQHDLLHGSVILEIRLDEHILAHLGKHFLVDHIPHAVFLFGRGHIIAILDRRADRAGVHEHFADDIRAHGRGMHNGFKPIHIYTSLFPDCRPDLPEGFHPSDALLCFAPAKSCRETAMGSGD